MTHAYLALGTNMGDRRQQMQTAIRLIEKAIGEVVALSTFYETEPWGFNSKHNFLNAAVCVETELAPFDLLDATEAIERRMGRRYKTLKGQYADRPMDIDLLLYDDQVIDTPRLQVPHPRMGERAFVLQPMVEIAPDVVHPVIGQTIAEMWRQLSLAEEQVG